MENCSRPNSGTVSRIQFKIVITQYWVVVLSSYLEANMRKTPNEWSTKWLPWQCQLPSNGTLNLHFNIEYFKN